MIRIRKKQGYLNELRAKESRVSIGIIGTHSGAGATTLALSMANYMAGCLKKKVAICDYGDSRDFEKIRDILCSTECKNGLEEYFTYKGVDLYINGKINPPNMNNSYDVVINDYGNGREKFSEFILSHHKIIMGTLEPWHIMEVNNFIETCREFGIDSSSLFVLHGDNRDIVRISRDYNLCAIKRPVIESSWIVDKELINFYQTLL